MRLADHLERLASGARPDGDWLLGTASLTTAAGDVYGEEAIVAAFRRHPLALDGPVVRTPTGIARFGADGALVADIYDGHVARLWRVGGDAGGPERRVDVAFDPDLAQPRGNLIVDAGAVDLDAAGLARLAAVLTPLIRDTGHGAFRRRGFVIRAFADGPASAALVAVYTAGASVGFDYLAIALTDDGTTIVADRPAPGPWSPRL